MTSYFHDDYDKRSPAHTNVHLQFTNRMCRNLNNNNEQVIKVLWSVLNKERSQDGSSRITFNTHEEFRRSHNKYDGFHLVYDNINC